MTLEQSYSHCETVARSRARNFYYSFVLLTPPQRKAMCAVYAFMRYCDDLSDDPRVSDRAGAIERWREDLECVLAGGLPPGPTWPAFRDTVRRYSIPHQYFRDMIAGVKSDLQPRTVRTFDDLYRYCYLVASVVGLTVVHIFGFESRRALELAEKCGIAFQLTNILRDVREDALNGRVYLPQEDLERFGVDPEWLCRDSPRPEFRQLMAFEAGRASQFYEESLPLVGLVHRRSRPSLSALIEIYRRLLDRIEASGFDVLTQRVRVPAWEKVWVVARSAATPAVFLPKRAHAGTGT